jgi:hypothetical protein
MFKKLLNIATLSCVTLSGIAQLSVQLIVPRLSPKLSELINQSENINIIVTNTTSQNINFRTVGTLSLDNIQIANLTFQNSPVEAIGPMQVKTYKVRDLHVLKDALNYNNAIVKQIQRSGYVPAGYLNWCFQLVSVDNRSHTMSQNICKGTVITTYQPPLIISPDNGSSYTNDASILFRWSPVTPSYPADLGNLIYRLQVFEILPGQNDIQSIRTNQPFWSRETMSTQFIWPFEVPKEVGNYAWIVKAYDKDGFEIGLTDKFSDFRSFTINESIKVTKTETDINSKEGFVKMIFSESSIVKYEMIIPNSSTIAVKKLFEASKQSEKYDLKLEIIKSIPLDANNVGLPNFDNTTSLISVYTQDGEILTIEDQDSTLFPQIWKNKESIIEDFIHHLKNNYPIIDKQVLD